MVSFSLAVYILSYTEKKELHFCKQNKRNEHNFSSVHIQLHSKQRSRSESTQLCGN